MKYFPPFYGECKQFLKTKLAGIVLNKNIALTPIYTFGIYDMASYPQICNIKVGFSTHQYSKGDSLGTNVFMLYNAVKK